MLISQFIICSFIQIQQQFKYPIFSVTDPVKTTVVKKKKMATTSRCISKIMLPVKRCRQQVCLGKRFQRQPSGNHIYICV